MTKRVTPTLRIPGLPDAGQFVDADLRDRVHAQVRALVAKDGSGSDPRFRIGADLVIDVLQDDGTYKRFEVIANGTLLRDPESRRVWPFPLGPALVRDAIPRIVAAAAANGKQRYEEKDRDG